MHLLITSDSHDRWDHLARAVELGQERGCEELLFAGDFMSPPGLSVLERFAGPIHFVFGNNDGEQWGLTHFLEAMPHATLYGPSMQAKIAGLSFFMTHYPEHGHAAGASGLHDVVVYGHDHLYNDETLENGTRLLNPGEVQGFKTGTATCMLFDTESKSAERVELATWPR